eukprot:4671285-Amphidinium_carterae.1
MQGLTKGEGLTCAGATWIGALYGVPGIVTSHQNQTHESRCPQCGNDKRTPTKEIRKGSTNTAVCSPGVQYKTRLVHPLHTLWGASLCGCAEGALADRCGVP